MAENPIKTPLPADLPEDWTGGQTVAPTGAEVGLSEQHGYNYLMEQVRRHHRQNKVNYTTVACFLSGILAQLCVAIGFGTNLDRIMIGDIMLFIPGLVIVNGVREFFYADILTGVYRLIEALLIAGAIAVGYAVSLVIGGQIL